MHWPCIPSHFNLDGHLRLLLKPDDSSVRLSGIWYLLQALQQNDQDLGRFQFDLESTDLY